MVILTQIVGRQISCCLFLPWCDVGVHADFVGGVPNEAVGTVHEEGLAPEVTLDELCIVVGNRVKQDTTEGTEVGFEGEEEKNRSSMSVKLIK